MEQSATTKSCLKILEHLSYILECFLVCANGEAKSELDTLINRLDSDPRYAVGDAGEIALKLRRAVEDYSDGEERRGASLLGQVSRSLWKRVPVQ